jgi:hypothetical protein
VLDVRRLLENRYADLRVAVAGGMDFEAGFDPSGGANAKGWADGYDEFTANANTNLYYINFGAASGCPPVGSCSPTWTQDVYWYISGGVGLVEGDLINGTRHQARGATSARGLPEIYSNTGNNAEQWVLIALAGWDNHPTLGPEKKINFLVHLRSAVRVLLIAARMPPARPLTTSQRTTRLNKVGINWANMRVSPAEKRRLTRISGFPRTSSGMETAILGERLHDRRHAIDTTSDEPARCHPGHCDWRVMFPSTHLESLIRRKRETSDFSLHTGCGQAFDGGKRDTRPEVVSCSVRLVEWA